MMTEKQKSTLFKPGQCGNPGGRPKGAFSLKTLLEQQLKAKGKEDAKKIVERLISEARDGNIKAMTLIFNYLEGKPVERKELTGPEGEAIKVLLNIDTDAV